MKHPQIPAQHGRGFRPVHQQSIGADAGGRQRDGRGLGAGICCGSGRGSDGYFLVGVDMSLTARTLI